MGRSPPDGQAVGSSAGLTRGTLSLSDGVSDETKRNRHDSTQWCYFSLIAPMSYSCPFFILVQHWLPIVIIHFCPGVFTANP